MRILIYGAGIQGSYLAHILAQNNKNEVTVLARNQRKHDLKQHGLSLYHQLQRKQTTTSVRVIETLEPADYYDLIFVTMKYNDFNQVLPLLAKNSSQNIIFVGNQMDTGKLQEQLDKRSPTPKNIVFGFQTTGGTRKDGQISILRFGAGKLKLYESLALGKMTPLLVAAFNQLAYKWEKDPKLDLWLKSHAGLVMILTSLDYLLQQSKIPKSEQKQLMRLSAEAYPEMFTILTQNGYAIYPPLLAKLFNQPKRAYLLLRGIYATPILKMQQGDFAEIVAMYEDFDQFKQQNQLTLPHYESLRDQALAKYQKTTRT